jgi:hypothetical protein
MSWAKLLADNRVTALPSSKAELDNLRSIVARSLKDVAAPGLSADARFVMAYDAAGTLSLLIVRAAGYRPRSVGAHYNTFLALEAADPAFAALSAYFDGCRMKRNSCEYDVSGQLSAIGYRLSGLAPGSGLRAQSPRLEATAKSRWL